MTECFISYHSEKTALPCRAILVRDGERADYASGWTHESLFPVLRAWGQWEGLLPENTWSPGCFPALREGYRKVVQCGVDIKLLYKNSPVEFTAYSVFTRVNRSLMHNGWSVKLRKQNVDETGYGFFYHPSEELGRKWLHSFTPEKGVKYELRKVKVPKGAKVDSVGYFALSVVPLELVEELHVERGGKK